MKPLHYFAVHTQILMLQFRVRMKLFLPICLIKEHRLSPPFLMSVKYCGVTSYGASVRQKVRILLMAPVLTVLSRNMPTRQLR